MNDRGPVDVLHRSTLHGEPPLHPARLLPFRPLDPTNAPAPLKRYHGVESVPLPRGGRRSSLPAAEVLSGRRAAAAELDDALLATLLFLTAGVTRVARTVDGRPIWLRTAMSAGNLHPVEVYVVRDGVHHYQPLEHALVPVRRTVDAGPATSLVLTGIPFRTCWKYGERGWRHLWWDAGTMLANLLAAADAHGVPIEIDAGFPDADVAALAGIDGIDEVPLVVARLGAGELRLPPADALEPVTVQAEPVATRVLRFPLVVEAQAATALDAGAVAAWRDAALRVSRPAPASVQPPPDGAASDRVEDVIIRRGSSRVFRRVTAPRVLLDWALAAAARAVPLDAAPAGTLLEHLVNLHDVAGVAAGGYVYSDERYESRTRSQDPRRVGAHLCLDQPLGGDSAYTVFHAARLDPLLDALGGRGYRAAHLEAGIVAGRLALNAVACGAGATGLTFYDGLVSRYFDTDAAPLLATAVGTPATSPAPSGTPGKPAELRGYGRLMARVLNSLRR